MKNLCKLKVLKDFSHYEHLSITEDLTIKERNKIKKLHQEAKKLNAEDDNNTYLWRVRGSPRTSLRLQKIAKKFLNCK